MTDEDAPVRVISERRQMVIGAGLSLAVIAAWAAFHIIGVFFVEITLPVLLLGPFLILLGSWLFVGLFIVSHDAIHGVIFPGRPRLNAAVGWLTATLYAGFDFGMMTRAHHRHHDAPGTEDDPDFAARHPDRFWPWFWTFMGRYMSLRPIVFIQAVLVVEFFLLGAEAANLLLFYAAPAILSPFQLFYFGTYRPHRHERAGGFADTHNARSSGYGWLVSLLTCFHFGYHHEHHLYPREPWWRLPARSRKGAA